MYAHTHTQTHVLIHGHKHNPLAQPPQLIPMHAQNSMYLDTHTHTQTVYIYIHTYIYMLDASKHSCTYIRCQYVHECLLASNTHGQSALRPHLIPMHARHSAPQPAPAIYIAIQNLGPQRRVPRQSHSHGSPVAEAG